jgi:uncharacterized protein YgiM (DUF1202 family)
MKQLFIGLLFIVLTAATSQAAIKMVSISGDNINMRSGPGEKYRVIWELGKGFPLRVIEQKGNWLKVSDFEGDTGWVYKKLTSDSPHLIVKVHKDKKKKINIRTGPGTNYRIAGKAYYGVVFKTLKRDKDWVQVRHENGLTGWIKRSLLWGW